METQTNDTNTKLSAIDKALAAAQARKAAKEGVDPSVPKAKPSKPKGDKIKVDAAAKAAAKEAKDAARQARQELLKQQREVRKAAKAQEKASGKPAHMKKIEKAASKLPELNKQMEILFNEATSNFSAAQISALALHLQHFNRVKATERALNQKLEIGMTVRIVGGDPKFIGLTGTVDRAQRIRCYVAVPGFKKPVYLFTSDVEATEQAMAATGTEG
jgi:hypothetical protein